MSPSSMESLPFPKKVWAGTKLRFQRAGGLACLEREVSGHQTTTVGSRPCITSACCSRATQMRQEEAPTRCVLGAGASFA